MHDVSWFEFAQAIFQQAEQQGIIDKQPILNNIKDGGRFGIISQRIIFLELRLTSKSHVLPK